MERSSAKAAKARTDAAEVRTTAGRAVLGAIRRT